MPSLVKWRKGFRNFQFQLILPPAAKCHDYIYRPMKKLLWHEGDPLTSPYNTAIILNFKECLIQDRHAS